MRKIILLFFVTIIFGTAVFAQNNRTKSSGLPAGIAGWKGADSDKILTDATIKTRLRKFLGKKNYAEFTQSFETLNPIERKGNFLFTSGCLIHACGHLESAIAIDLTKNTIHAAVFNEEKKTAYFNEKGAKTPELIIAWAKNLKKNKKKFSMTFFVTVSRLEDCKTKNILTEECRNKN